MKRVLFWIYKLVICAALGYLGFRYMRAFTQWLTHSVLVYFGWLLVLLAYLGVAAGFAWIDDRLWSVREATKPKLVRGALCAAMGLPTVVLGAVDFWNGVNGQSYLGFAILLFVYIGFAGMLFMTGFGSDAKIVKQ